MLLSLIHNGLKYHEFTEEELKNIGVPGSVIAEAIVTAEMNNILTLRQSAYKKESDPLYMEWQYDQTTESEKAWRDKVAEIKARYPLPTETQPTA